MKRYEEFVLEVDKKVMTFETSKGTGGKVNTYSDRYVNPPIPEGYVHICGEWNNGFVIHKCSSWSEFVWIPVASLDSNGTLDGDLFNEKFGRRNYRNNKFSKSEYHETMTDELGLQVESVRKYGGFYFSCYNISINKKTGRPQSVKGSIPLVNIKINNARRIAAEVENSELVKSHLIYGAEYDSVLEWLIKSGARTFSEIVENSTNWGNFWNAKNSKRRLVETGSKEEWCTNNIYDFAGNLDELTQEQNNKYDFVVRGGSYKTDGDIFPVANRCCCSCNDCYPDSGFRAALCIM